ncbi:MAG: family 16 glycoside hydrolase [Planctomycetaceae bacterium]
MSIQIQCPNQKCQQTVSVQEEVSGRNVKCRKCGTTFVAVPTKDGHSGDKPLRSPGSDKGLFTSFPSEFGRYRIEKLLGKGGMGAVYLAIDTQLNRKVALKIPFFDAKEEPKRAERFIREARAAASLNHPNICTVYDVGEVNGRPFITMAYIVGQPLEDLFDEDRLLPVPVAAEIVRKMALALQKAHDLSIVHRDLKPANVMITPDGEPVIMDFGLAKVIGEIDGREARLTQEGAILGTPRYMAPEQVNGDQKAIGPATDIYALGVMLFELLTGRAPYSGALLTILSQIASSPVPNVCDFQSGLDVELSRVCRKAMDKIPASRFESMEQFADALLPFIPPSNVPSQKFKLTGLARSEAATVSGNVDVRTLADAGDNSERNPVAETTLSPGQKPSDRKTTLHKTQMTAAKVQAPENVNESDNTSRGPSFISRFLSRAGTAARGIVTDPNRLALFISGIAGFAIIVLVAAISIRHLTRNQLPVKTTTSITPPSAAGSESGNAGQGTGGDSAATATSGSTTMSPPETANAAKDATVASVEDVPDAAAAAAAAANPAMDSSVVPVQDFVPMFNSSDLSGWTSVSGGGWSRNGDTIIGQARPGILLSERGYVDFELSLEYRLSSGGNSGVFVRVPDANPRPGGEDLIEVQLLDFSSLADDVAPYKSGSVIGFFPQVNKPGEKQGDWNELRIVLQRDHIQTFINGELVVDGELSEKTRTSSFTGVIATQGRIGLQQRGDGLTEFRNVRIRDLTAPAAGTTEISAIPEMSNDLKQWQSLFNGQDLSGWTIARGSAINWSVQDSEDTPGAKELVAIAQSTESESWLMTQNDYSDFTMRFEFRMRQNSKTSGGLGFRMDKNDTQLLPIKIMDDSDPTDWAKQRGEKTGVVWTPTSAGPLMMFPPQQSAGLNQKSTHQVAGTRQSCRSLIKR